MKVVTVILHPLLIFLCKQDSLLHDNLYTSKFQDKQKEDNWY